MLRIRIDQPFKELLEKAVKEGKAENMSQLIRDAVKNFLEKEIEDNHQR
jgi:Arc/MetJ-type ribon-helix-helix transcriptional regulator